MLPWNRPGARAEPTSAMTSTVMVVGVTPTSVACSVVVAHWLAAVVVVAAAAAVEDGPPAVGAVVALRPLREHAPAASDATTSTASDLVAFIAPPRTHDSNCFRRRPGRVPHVVCPETTTSHGSRGPRVTQRRETRVHRTWPVTWTMTQLPTPPPASTSACATRSAR